MAEPIYAEVERIPRARGVRGSERDVRGDVRGSEVAARPTIAPPTEYADISTVMKPTIDRSSKPASAR